ncbi:2-hydroxyacid dehydrogenase [[Ruminococcus] lactaris]|uniref:2-hydroxyacid dehydrogenase n=1 Tax=[Ruminococcus] lactaris TaxID=46228 RepID=UPI00307AB33B
MKVAIVGTYPAGTFEKFKNHFSEKPEIEVVEVDTQKKFDALTEADAIVLRILKMPKEVVARIKGLKMIMRWGAGFDSVDIEEAGKHGIYVCNTPGANAYAVAELTVALMLAVGRKLICHDRAIHQGEWSKNTFLNQTRTLNNKVVGIIGGGNIGRQVASRVQAFGSTVQYYDPFRLPEEMEEKLHMKYVGLEELIRTSDVITLHVPLMASTRHMIGEKEIEKMKDGAILINVARGGLMDDGAVVNAVNAGKLSGAGIDCVEEEPAKLGSPILENPNIIVTPHVGGGSADISDVMFPMITENIELLEEEKALKYVVNKQYILRGKESA